MGHNSQRQYVTEYNDTIHSVTQFTLNYLMNKVLPNIVPKEFLVIPNFLNDKRLVYENSVKAHQKNKIKK